MNLQLSSTIDPRDLKESTGKVPPKNQKQIKNSKNQNKKIQKKIKQLTAFDLTNFGIFLLITGLTRQSPQDAMIFRIICHDNDPYC
jgi:hypothetical protein